MTQHNTQSLQSLYRPIILLLPMIMLCWLFVPVRLGPAVDVSETRIGDTPMHHTPAPTPLTGLHRLQMFVASGPSKKRTSASICSSATAIMARVSMTSSSMDSRKRRARAPAGSRGPRSSRICCAVVAMAHSMRNLLQGSSCPACSWRSSCPARPYHYYNYLRLLIVSGRFINIVIFL